MSFVVYVKLGTGRLIPVDVRSRDTVYTIKQELCQQHAIQPQNVSIIFQGKHLEDSFMIQDSDLRQNSILHAVLRPRSTSDETPDSPSMQTLGTATSKSVLADPGCGVTQTVEADAEEPLSMTGSSQARCMLYYVYCKGVCDAVCPGRIRVRCSMCKLGTIELAQEPCCWEDVLVPGRIAGVCLTDGCTSHSAEFYFKCSSHAAVSETDSVVVLQQITANINSTPCITCTDVSSPVLVYSCKTTHVMCMACFCQYCETRLNDRQFIYSSQHGYTLGCPAGCADSLIREAHHYRVLGTQQYERYQRFATEECLLQEGGVLCPAPGCGEGLFPDDNRRVQCVRPECQFEFCRDCRRGYHEDGSCDFRTEAEPGGRWSAQLRVCDPHELQSLSTIQTISKACPRCKVPVERDGGCMHMTCTRCGEQWCWLCMTTWTRDCQADHWFQQVL